jgi:hypothetical protein
MTHPFTFENAKAVKLVTLRDAYEAAFSIRALALEISDCIDRIRQPEVELGGERYDALFAAARLLNTDVWEAARRATEILADLGLEPKED